VSTKPKENEKFSFVLSNESTFDLWSKVVQIERNTKQKKGFFVFISEMQPTFDVSQSTNK